MLKNIGIEELLLLSVLAFFFIIFMSALVCIIRNKSLKRSTKLHWIIAVLFLPIHGAIAYFFVGREQNDFNP